MVPTPSSTLSRRAFWCQVGLRQIGDKLAESVYLPLHSTATDEEGRFRVWTANIGVLKDASSPSSLDARLKLAEHMTASVAAGLERLSNAKVKHIPGVNHLPSVHTYTSLIECSTLLYSPGDCHKSTSQQTQRLQSRHFRRISGHVH